MLVEGAPRARQMVRVLLGVLVPLLVVATWAAPASAYPWMIRHGFAKCASCHVDPSGGETLTGFGRAIGDSRLTTRWDGSKNPRSLGELFYGVEEPEWLRLGGSLRYMNIYQFPKGSQKGDFDSFPMQIDTYGQVKFGKFRAAGSIGIAKVPTGSRHARAAQITTGQGDQVNLISRNHWLGYDINDHVLVRAGRINLPFGMRIPEHVMWVRTATRTDRESDQQHGVAVSYSKGRFRGELMGVAGNYQISPDAYRERGYSLYGEYLLAPKLGLGISSEVLHAKEDRIFGGERTRQAHGVMARYSPIFPLVFLAEADVLLRTDADVGYVGFLQTDYEAIQGLHFMATGEIQDQGADKTQTTTVPGSGEPQLGGWLTVNWFFFSHWNARVDLVARQQEPITLQGQLHFYF